MDEFSTIKSREVMLRIMRDSIKILEDGDQSLASSTNKCQIWLFLGLLLRSIVAIVTFVLSLAASALPGA